MKSFWIFLAVLGFTFSAGVVVYQVGALTDRVEKLEQRCDSRCRYGDEDCAHRCDKAGHCPFQN